MTTKELLRIHLQFKGGVVHISKDIDIKSFIDAIEEKLEATFPNFSAYDEDIVQKGYENCFNIRLINARQKRILGKRCKRDYDFDISFYPENDSIDSFYAWEEEMFLSFDTLTVGESMYHTKDVEISSEDGNWRFTFAVSFFVVQNDDTDLMEDLTQVTGVYTHE